MYNRYIRNDSGSYTRIPEEEARPQAQSPPPVQPERPNPPPREAPPAPPPDPPGHQSRPAPNGPGRAADGLTSFLRHILDRLHMDHVDTGDLLLLILLFFLFREDADEELLVSLGLLLIL